MIESSSRREFLKALAAAAMIPAVAHSKEQQNLAGDPRYSETVTKMRGMLERDLESFDRPFGEFVPGGDAAPPGLIGEQLELVKKIRIQGKKVILPDSAVIEEQSPPDRQRKATDRENRRAGRRRQSQAK